jgi:hypothetical protein
MRPISNKKHLALVTALDVLCRQSEGEIDVISVGEKTKELVDVYQQYEKLLNELSGCIHKYESLHHTLKTDVLGPLLKEAKKKGETVSDQYLAAIEYIKVSRFG